MKIIVETITTSAYITLFFVIFSLFIFKTPASHIRIEAFEPFYLTEFFRDSNIIRKVCSESHICHIICIKPRYSRPNGGKKKLLFRMFVGKIPQVTQIGYQIFFCDFLHIFIQRRNSIGLPLQSFGLSHDCTEFLNC